MSSGSSASLFEADESRQDMYSGVAPANATNNFAVDTNTKINFINGTSTNNTTFKKAKTVAAKVVKKRVFRILTP